MDAAIKRSDVFVFEVSTDSEAQAEIRALIAEDGMLPPGQSLRAIAAPASHEPISTRRSPRRICRRTMVDHEQPWLASLQLLVAEGAAKHYSADAGRGHAVMAIAARRTSRRAISRPSSSNSACWRGSDDKLQLSEFESDLKDFGQERRRSGGHGCRLEERPGRQLGQR